MKVGWDDDFSQYMETQRNVPHQQANSINCQKKSRNVASTQWRRIYWIYSKYLNIPNTDWLWTSWCVLFDMNHLDTEHTQDILRMVHVWICMVAWLGQMTASTRSTPLQMFLGSCGVNKNRWMLLESQDNSAQIMSFNSFNKHLHGLFGIFRSSMERILHVM